MKLMNRWLACEVLFVHVFHGALFVAALVVIAANTDRGDAWIAALTAPLVLFSLAFWLFEGSVLLPVAVRLWRGGGAFKAGKQRSHEAKGRNDG